MQYLVLAALTKIADPAELHNLGEDAAHCWSPRQEVSNKICIPKTKIPTHSPSTTEAYCRVASAMVYYALIVNAQRRR